MSDNNQQTTNSSNDEVTKLRDINREAFAERDGLKGKVKDLSSQIEELKSKLEVAQKQSTLNETELLKSQLAEKDKRFSEFESQVKVHNMDQALTQAFKGANITEINAAMKLVDKSILEFDGIAVTPDSLKKAMELLQKDSAFLFNQPVKDTPPTKEVSKSTGKGTYVEELQALRAAGKVTPLALQALRKKHGKDY